MACKPISHPASLVKKCLHRKNIYKNGTKPKFPYYFPIHKFA